MVVAKWSACSPTYLAIRGRIQLKSRVIFLKLLVKRTNINKQRPGFAPFKNTLVMKPFSGRR